MADVAICGGRVHFLERRVDTGDTVNEAVRLARFVAMLLQLLDYLHNNNKISRFVIDEVHCVSHWG